MKKFISILLCMICVLTVVSCSKTPATTSATTDYNPETLSEKYFYCLGYFLGNNYKEVYKDIDFTAVSEGMKAAENGTFKFTDQELQSIAQEYETTILRKEAEENLVASEAFLAENAKKEGIKTTASGLQYEVIKQGTGVIPTEKNSVTVDYELFDKEGNLLQSTIVSGSTATFQLTGVIDGFKEGLMLMPVGSEYKLYIHPGMGYGENAPSSIGPNQALVFDVTLHSVQ